MEYVDGEDLGSLLKRIGHLPPEKALDIAQQLCAGLAAAHDLGILHRDLKPANVMLDGRGRVRITDFGLAAAAERLQAAQPGFGTPAYMAPEQLEGQPASARSDVYALGLVMYELFTGRRAFEASSVEELHWRQNESMPASPRLLVEGLDPAVERAILRCLEPDPALRPASARAVAAARAGGDPIAAALAAGETPSPDLVAASGPEGALSSQSALATLGAMLVMLVLLVLLSDRASMLGWVPWIPSPDVLEDNARRMLKRLGHDLPAVDQARLIGVQDQAYVAYVHTHDESPDRWKALRDPGPLAGQFLYRQGSRYLVPSDGTDG
jgi:Protein kinase domain